METPSRTDSSPSECEQGEVAATEVTGRDMEDVDVLEEDTEKEAGEEVVKDEEAGKRAAGELATQRKLLAIEELVLTERNYLRHLRLCSVTIRSNLQKVQPPLANLDTMFLHIQEVMDVSERLLTLLDRGQPSNPGFLSLLCDAFLSLRTDMEAAYREYLAGYGNVTALENSYKQKEAVWQEVVKVVKASAPEVNASSPTFFLVMPVQRIARYPLLLQTIQKHTDPRDPAYLALEDVARIAVDMNCKINEYKRFREVADKYKKTETLSIRDKINRLNGHSIAKKTARLGQFLKHETGIVPKVIDEEFDALAGFFCVLERGITDLHENVENFLGHLQAFLACRPEERDLDLGSDRGVVSYREITAALKQWIYPTFERRVRTLVHRPLCSLREMLAGPRNLIRKRLDKLLDYEALGEKSGLSYEEQAVAGAYRTINALLVAELPQFNGTALQLLWGILGAFSCLQRDLAADTEQLFASYTHELPHSLLEPSAFWEWASAAVCEEAKRLDAIFQNVQEELNAPIVQPLSPSSQRRLQVLMERHSPEKIYQLTRHVVGSRELDLTLQRGELVALVSEMDTRGDRRRWLVDAGGPRGYVPSSKLVRYRQVTKEVPPSPHFTTAVGREAIRRHSYSPESHPFVTMAMPCFQVFAGYDFTARSHHEVTLRSGEPVKVLEPHDKRGNRDWSLVEVRGRRGYVPSNYLAVLPSVVAPPTAPFC
ncbi:rho guanine nucleotide exchange factor 37 isoform X2 [Scleropages formosus]|nr:rho guanine nucleotide exchange factor 37 isoform X2 [Scleropages formosus]XP_029113364.1 rho guanine nucleotide exchange factor 37 isoform X2 [Scleropages formosus]XP_029113365.1 rho guanine nucleotide exchange factor 37 isoform X2 [Scleropages formosus]XP_029113366.1 rho guanine nucleotide exchange factor 37 isoform X2 [Scleropages formosus]